MLGTPVFAQSGFDLPQTGGGWVIWLLLSAGIIGLFVIINRTRKRSYRDYMDREKREAELRANDPDMKKEE
ncbi:MAG: LPXTG cell wall anchor domain-containing protein [Actinomycetota bacterium]